VSAAALLDVVAGSLAFGIVGCAAAWQMYRRARADRAVLALVLADQAQFAEATRRLAGASGASVEAVRDAMVRAVHELAPAIDVVAFFEEHDAQLVCVAAHGARFEFFGGTRLALDDDGSIVVAALQRGHRVTALDAPAARRLHPSDRFAAAIPLLLDAGRRCVVYLGSDYAAATSGADRILALIDQSAPAYRIALERADDRARAEFDGLTGLLTARAFRTRLAALIEPARFAPLGRVSLLFIDTDRFKSWNDNYGHGSGDALLRELALLLRAAATDPADLVARNGGDEFCVVFADCEKSRAIERADRLRASIADADFRPLQPAGVDAQVRISASIGVACFPVDARTPSALLEKADEAMYHSKKTGRDAVAYFGVEGTLIRAESNRSQRPDPERRRG
jgi:diguanylate cyclase (GGDEF)-like protein